MTEPTATPQDRARVHLRQLTGEALLALLRTRDDVTALEATAEGVTPAPPYMGCDALSLGDPEAPPSAAEERCWRLSLAFLELEGLAGLEYETAEVWDAAGEFARVETLARLTDEGEREALEVLRRWNAEAVPVVGQALRGVLARCAALAIRLEPPEDEHTRALVEHGGQLLADVRHLLAMLDAQDEAATLPGMAPAELAGLVAVGEDGSRVYAGDVWAHVKAEAGRHAAAILAALEHTGRHTPETLAAYAFECLNLAHLLGASLDEPETGGARHA